MIELPVHTCPSWCQQHRTLPSGPDEPDYVEHRAWAVADAPPGYAVPLVVGLEQWTTAGVTDDHTARLVARFRPSVWVQLPGRFKPVDGVPMSPVLSLRAVEMLRDALTDVLEAVADAPRCPCGELADANGHCDECRPTTKRLRLVE